MEDRPDFPFEFIREFAAVARRLSFRRAAADLVMDPTVLSRRIMRLERRLGVRLLHRNTRKVVLTEAGDVFLRRCDDLLIRLADAEAEVSRYASGPTGTLRLAVPNLFGQLQIAPLIPEFMALHPGLRINVTFSDRMADLLDEHHDAAVRIGALEAGGDLRMLRLATNRRLLCASPAYLEKYGAPLHPSELASHRILHFSPMRGGDAWQLDGSAGSIEAPISPVLRADNAEVLRLAAIMGQGVALLATFVASADLAAGRLVPLLRDWRPAESTVSLVYPNAPFVPQKVRAVAGFLAEKFAGTPPWEHDGQRES